MLTLPLYHIMMVEYGIMIKFFCKNMGKYNKKNSSSLKKFSTLILNSVKMLDFAPFSL